MEIKIDEEVLGAYIEGNLSAGDAALVERELARRPELKRMVEEIKAEFIKMPLTRSPRYSR